jgi:predicted dehydrogenase
MTTNEHLRVAIIGFGLIGTEWNRSAPVDAPTLTHARAFSQHPPALLVALCNRDGERARNAAQYWQVDRVYNDLRQLFKEQCIDMANIAAYSMARCAIIEAELAAGVKILVIEKPLATTLEESCRLVAALDDAGARSVVNYSRILDSSMLELKDRFATGAMSRVQRVVTTYGEGIGNTGSHLIDLIGFLCSARPVRARALGSLFDASEACWSPTGERAWNTQFELIDAIGVSINLTLLVTDQRAFTDKMCDIAQPLRKTHT